jgi:hypothetical protein
VRGVCVKVIFALLLFAALALLLGAAFAPAPVTVQTEVSGITADTTLKAASANLRLFGITARESAATAAAATLIVRHGVVSAGNCTGNVIAFIELGANQSFNMWYSDRGLSVPNGVCADVLAGTVDVNILTVEEPL